MEQEKNTGSNNQMGDGLYHYSYKDNNGAETGNRPQDAQNSDFQMNANGTQSQHESTQMNMQGTQPQHGNPQMNPQGTQPQHGGMQMGAQNMQQRGPQMGAQNMQHRGPQMNVQNGRAYNGFERNVNGMEAWYDSQKMNNGYQTGSASQSLKPEKKKKKEHNVKKNGMGMKIVGLVAAAAVFGLVAAAVFQGVRYGSDKMLNRNAVASEASSEASTDSNVPQLKTASSDTVSTVYDVSTVAKNVMPSIVSITGTYVTTYDYWFNSYQQESTGAGSGIIIGKDDKYLYVATNYHVVENAKSLSVTFVDDKSADATVKGYVENNDIAIVTVKLSDISDDTLNEIKEIQVGSSDDLAVGDPCVAIGNALGYGQSVTVGYISALNREISASDETVKVLQTDAAINPGNSGGALVNMKGELIGINTAKYSDTSVEGMGYALPISDVQDLINDLIAGKDVSSDGTTSGQAYLGISAQTITSQYSQLLNMPEGVYVSSVEQGSAAEECGLQSGDIICSLDGEDIADMETFHDKIVACKPGDKVTIVYYRNNNGNYEKQTATATLKEKQ